MTSNVFRKNVIAKVALILLPLLFLAVSLLALGFARHEKSLYNAAERLATQQFNVGDTGSAKILLDAAGQPKYILIEYSSTGYAILHKQTEELLEYSHQSVSPYSGISGSLIYEGPGQYFVSHDGILTNLMSGERTIAPIVDTVSKESEFFNQTSSIGAAMKKRSDTTFQNQPKNNISPMSGKDPLSPPNGSAYFDDGIYIPNADFFLARPMYANNDGYPVVTSNGKSHEVNSLGVCATIAAQLFLSYHNYHSDRRMIPAVAHGTPFLASDYGDLKYWPSFIDPAKSGEKRQLGTTNDMFIDLLGEHILAEYQDSLSTRNGIESFLKKHYLDESGNSLSKKNVEIHYGFWNPVKTRSEACTEINAGRPLILGTQLYSGHGLHYVVAYGYAVVDGVQGFVVDWGWQDSSHHVWTNADWYDTFIKMRVYHEHSYTIEDKPFINEGMPYEVLECSICGQRAIGNAFFDTTDIGTNEIRIDRVNVSIDGVLDIPSIIENKKVTEIAEHAFANTTGLTDISIPSSVVSIGVGALHGCNNLQNIILNGGNTVYKVEGDCLIEKMTNTVIFGNRYSLIPNYIVGISDYAFYGADITRLTLPRSLKTIGAASFYGCENLTEIVLPQDFEAIGSNAFMNCGNLNTIKVPSAKYVALGSDVFAGCGSLTEIYIPKPYLSYYEIASNWRDLADKFEYLTTEITIYGYPELTFTADLYGSLADLPILEKPGYDFIGFGSTKGVRYDKHTIITELTDRITLYPQWTATEYNVLFRDCELNDTVYTTEILLLLTVSRPVAKFTSKSGWFAIPESMIPTLTSRLPLVISQVAGAFIPFSPSNPHNRPFEKEGSFGTTAGFKQ